MKENKCESSACWVSGQSMGTNKEVEGSFQRLMISKRRHYYPGRLLVGRAIT